MPGPDPIEVVGLKEFRKELKKVQDEFPKAINLVNNEVAEIVASAARASASSQGSTLAKASPSIRAMKGATKAQVAIGGANYPFAMGAEFGSHQYKQFKAWRGNGMEAGYALYPTIREKRPQVMERFGDLIDNLSKNAFPE